MPGRAASAAAAFAAVVKAPQTSPEQRWEALIRPGVARRDAGDAKGSADAFEEAWRSFGREEEALRFLLQAVGSALPGPERWQEVWTRVTLQVDRRVPERPVVRVSWPGITASLCPCRGALVTLDLKEADCMDALRLIADVSRLNVVVQPGVRGRLSISWHTRTA